MVEYDFVRLVLTVTVEKLAPDLIDLLTQSLRFDLVDRYRRLHWGFHRFIGILVVGRGFFSLGDGFSRWALERVILLLFEFPLFQVQQYPFGGVEPNDEGRLVARHLQTIFKII